MTDDTKQKQSYQNDVFNDSDADSMLTDLGDSEEQEEAPQKSGRGNQGFASMPKEKQREIASKGGKAAHAQGTAHEWTSAEAAEAGRRGGQSRSQSSVNNEEE